MEDREDLRSILPYLPVAARSSSIFWPSPVVDALKALSIGPQRSRVDSGKALFLTISDLRKSLSLTHYSERLASSAADGYAHFFDDLMTRAEAAKWFGEVVPVMANLVLRLPSLLEAHYQNADGNGGRMEGVKTGLRILESQEPGMVFLSQELIGALLACSFFCLFPSANRRRKHLPTINFDHLFAILYKRFSENQKNKIKCITHYFERICSSMPVGAVSFERKVLPLDHSSPCVSYPKADYWSESVAPLCLFEVYRSGKIEDHSCQALEVDFADESFGGLTLDKGCVQEEIRFMINPELIAGMLFLPSMADNEAIEIVGAERFSNYTGYSSSFRYSGDNVDNKDLDSMGRRRTRVIAVDALRKPGGKQFGLECLLREINKAFCGFLDQSKCQQYQRLSEDDEYCRSQIDQDVKAPAMSIASPLFHKAPSLTSESHEGILADLVTRSSRGEISQHVDQIGIATGNWGCGIFGGDPELKTTIQWLAASEASRPFISYYTFGLEALQNLDQVTEWILSHEWTVGELWNLLVEYSGKRLKGETKVGFFSWIQGRSQKTRGRGQKTRSLK